jgi:hypothetical protein
VLLRLPCILEQLAQKIKENIHLFFSKSNELLTYMGVIESIRLSVHYAKEKENRIFRPMYVLYPRFITMHQYHGHFHVGDTTAHGTTGTLLHRFRY